MSQARQLRVLCSSLALVAVLATGTASARIGQKSQIPAIKAGGCAHDSARQRTASSSDSRTNPARASALSQYDDFIEDVVAAPDICGANLITNDNVAITMGAHIHDRSGFSALDSYRIHLDTDSSPATGAPAEASLLAGAEFVIDVTPQTSTLSAWNGSGFAAVVPQPAIMTEWVPDYGPALQITRTALGSPASFNVALSTANGTDRDLAPDSGSWAYVVTPLALKAGRIALSSARAGRPFAAAMEVTRSDFEIALDEGSISCRGSIAGKKLSGRGSFDDDLVLCLWRLSRTTAGKRFQGSVAVTFQGATVKRSFNVRVR